MKRFLCTTIALMLVLSACSSSVASDPEPTEYVHTPYVSTITTEECYVCGESKESPAGLHWGEDNIGILNLNTFQVLRLEINRYEGGELIETPAGFMHRPGMKCNGTNVHATVEPDRGFANVRIAGQHQSINVASIQSQLCQTCLYKINDIYFGNYPPKEYAILNFADKSIRLLIQSTTFFTSENYGIDCDFEENGDINLLVFYCPPRYE